MQFLKTIISEMSRLEKKEKNNLFLMFATYFFVLGTYPFLQASTNAIYLQTYGAKATPIVGVLSVFALSLVIYFFNIIQKKIGLHRLFVLTAILSIFLFLLPLYMIEYHNIKAFSYLLVIWADIYIVLFVHFVFGYANNCYTSDEAKIFFGPIGAAGSLGGIIGGMATSYLSKEYGVNYPIIVSIFLILITSILFYFTKRLANEKEDKNIKYTPIKALKGAEKYVFMLIVVVALSQFIINIARLEFNFLFEKVVPDVNLKSSYFAEINTYINIITLFLQLIVLPFLFINVKNKSLLIFIPIVYIFITLFGLGIFATSFIIVSGSYVAFKSIDYSLFNCAKELLYYKLSPIQKYGAKYLADMFSYRFAKALISLVLIYFQSLIFLNTMIIVFSIFWIICIFILFRYQKKIEVINE